MNTPNVHSQAPEDRVRIPNRPLGQLSAYTALDLGDDLEEISTQKLSHAAFEEKCRTLSNDAVTSLHELHTKEELAVAHLDIMMLPQALQAIGLEIPEEVRALRGLLLTKDPDAVPMLTYEDIVLQNPSDDPRAFARGNIGSSELFFYEIHRQIEKEMTQLRKMLFETLINQTYASMAVKAITKDLSKKEFFLHEVDECCTDMQPQLSNVRTSMQQLFDTLDPSHFTAFRPYFNPRLDVKHGRLPGPSGNYSAGMYCFDTLCIGRQPLIQTLNESKYSEIRFFPRTSTSEYETQKQMMDVKGYLGLDSFTLEDCSLDYVRENAIQVMQYMKEIRDLHVRLFAKFIGSGLGTALKTPEYLTLAPRAYEQSISQLQ